MDLFLAINHKGILREVNCFGEITAISSYNRGVSLISTPAVISGISVVCTGRCHGSIRHINNFKSNATNFVIFVFCDTSENWLQNYISLPLIMVFYDLKKC